MAKKRMTVSFSDEATIKIQMLAAAKRISFALAANELILRGSDSFQVEVYNLTGQVQAMTGRVSNIETNLSSITDILASIAGSINIIHRKLNSIGGANGESSKTAERNNFANKPN